MRRSTLKRGAVQQGTDKKMAARLRLGIFMIMIIIDDYLRLFVIMIHYYVLLCTIMITIEHY